MQNCNGHFCSNQKFYLIDTKGIVLQDVQLAVIGNIKDKAFVRLKSCNKAHTEESIFKDKNWSVKPVCLSGVKWSAHARICIDHPAPSSVLLLWWTIIPINLEKLLENCWSSFPLCSFSKNNFKNLIFKLFLLLLYSGIILYLIN